MYYPQTRAIYVELAKKYGTTIEQMADICRSPLEFVVDTISTKANKETVEMPNIRITNFGVFYCPEGRKNFLRKLNYSKIQNGQSNREI